MKIFYNAKTLEKACFEAKSSGKKIAFVPTMGSLHDGHLALIEEAKKYGEFVVVSIFVNKAQFNDLSDFEKYPRQTESDLAKLGNVDAVFLPTHQEIYPNGIKYDVEVGKVGDILCGLHRKNHFAGVVLVVSRFFEIIKPDFAIFGKKDFQQFFIIKKMIEKNNLDIKIIGVETFREKSGLAMSSRNQRLDDDNKKIAAEIYRVLNDIKNDIKNVENIEKYLYNKSLELLEKNFEKIDYLEIRDEENLEKLSQKFDFEKKYRIFLAIYLQGVRLIDNMKI